MTVKKGCRGIYRRYWTAVFVAVIGFLSPLLIGGVAASRLLPISACGTIAGVAAAAFTFYLSPLRWASLMAVVLLFGGMCVAFNTTPVWGAALPGWMFGLAAGSILGDAVRTIRSKNITVS